MLKCLTILFIFLITASQLLAQPFALVGKESQATIVLSSQEPEYVRLAVEDLVNDVFKITGKKLSISADINDCQKGCVLVGSQVIADSKKNIQSFLPNASAMLGGKWEAYQVKSTAKALVITGSDQRGTMFGIYHFIAEYLNVDPLYFWSDMQPEKKAVLSWENISLTQQEPTFKYRGWFINDEDLLTEWVNSGTTRNIDYPFYKQVVSPEVMRQVLEAMLRLRYNLIIPASFIDIRNPAEAQLVKEAARRGLFLSMHHVEPMGVSAFTFFNYWQEKNNTKPLFSFYSSRKELEEVWQVYAREWALYPNVIWQIGLRGIADRPMWMADPGIPQTDADRGKLISEAMRVQMDIIREVDKRTDPPVTTTLWAEGAGLNQSGHLTFPPEATIIFADNSPGWKWQADFYETKREQGRNYGVYYHHQLWGSGPHLAQAIPPAKTYQVLTEAVNKGSTYYAILNVSNVREFVLGVNASAAMLYDFAAFKANGFLQNWCSGHFGVSGKEVAQAYQSYFDSFVVHDKQQVPLLLDGQIRASGRNVLSDLSLQLTDPGKYAEKNQKKAETVEANWGKRFLADMHPQEESLTHLLEKVRRQQTGLAVAQKQIEQVLHRISGNKKRFLEVNLLAHSLFMSGLLDWAEGVLQAKLAADTGNTDQVTGYLKNARQAFSKIQQAKEIGSRGEKWQYWYRGDKKMNLAEVEKLTGELIQKLEK